ncbi:hypothetical protein OD917_20085 [Flavobacterium sp. SH_e]|uniref:hypothetical protein n=1 Tax=Flavobacterium sp. SH_e TaxID=2983767 RepID=UPI0021E3B4D1|nr:hypothetical protein [Flavobacterium sp. SH_e]MCV2487244.1 hypothetical protein [Flavobacterium sp. SH_e]
MEDNVVPLNGFESFDGIVDKISIEYNCKSILITIKQWNGDETHNLSQLNFKNVIFQSLPDISSFNLINEIIRSKDSMSVLKQFDEYLIDNPTLSIPNAKDNIIDDVKKELNLESYLLVSGYCKDWLIICQEMILSEFENLPK